MRPKTADIDARMAPLIRLLWQRGFVTRYCCQGDTREGDSQLQAYIKFRSALEAALFAALAGPLAWDSRAHRGREGELPGGSLRWTWDWHLEGDTVRFPSRDLPRATAAFLRGGRALTALIGAVLEAPIPFLPALQDCPRCGWEQIQSPAAPAEPLPSAPGRQCPSCSGLVLERRKDARYCSRRCQLAARNRSEKPK
jgi:hypothetical protein